MSTTTNSVDDIQLHEGQLVTLPDAFLEAILSANPVELDYIRTFLRLALLQVSHQCNTFAIAACLPQDVLLLIFEHAVELKSSTFPRVLSQVCRRWRAIILEDPLLWRNALNFTDPCKWSCEVLTQTKEVPLWIYVNQHDFTEDYGENITLNASLVTGNHFSRCAILDLEGHSGEIEEILESINTDDGAPLLHLLSIRNISCSIREHLSNVPDRLLKTSMPRLKSLCLERCVFSWDAIHNGIASQSRFLTSLCISNVHDVTLATTLSQLYLVLQSFPLLQHLQLQDAIVVTTSDHGITPVTLHDLSSLRIRTSIDACTVFLAVIHMPSLIDLVVIANAVPESSPGCIGELMAGIQVTAPCSSYRSLGIVHNRGCLAVQLGHGRASKPVVEMVFRNWARQLPGDHFSEIVTNMKVIQSLRSMQELHVSLPYSVEGQIAPDAWKQFFRHFDRISDIHLGAQPPALLLRTLYQDAHTARLECSGGSLLLLPSLVQISSTPICGFRVFVNMIAELRASMVDSPATRALLQQCANDRYSDLDAVRHQIIAWASSAGDADIPEWVTMVESLEDESSIGDVEN
ncbi:hypothetical protein M404DRAFT_999726, partial [Pisolithus tinctorius Marx 270]